MKFTNLLDAIKWLRDSTTIEVGSVLDKDQISHQEIKTKVRFGLQTSKDFCDALMALGVERHLRVNPPKDEGSFAVCVLGSSFENKVIYGFTTRVGAEDYIRRNYDICKCVILPAHKEE